MSTFNSRIRLHERGLARALMHARRSPLEGTSTTESITVTHAAALATTSDEVEIIYKLPRSTKALIAICSILGAIFMLLAAWKIRQLILKKRKPTPTWRSSLSEKRTGKGSLWRFSNADIGVQAPQRVILPHNAAPGTDASIGWTPQVKPWMTGGKPTSMEAGVAPPLPAKMKELQRMEDELLASAPRLVSPPPTYLARSIESAESKTPSPRTESQPLLSAPLTAGRFLPPAPPAPSRRPPSPPQAQPPTPPSSLKLKFVPGFAHVNAPAPSPPRTSSFASQQSTPPAVSRPTSSASTDSAGSGSGRRGKRVPRDMVVVQTFVPSLDDELAVVVGETLRLVEEFADGWCLCQRVGRSDGAVVKGVLPRFCLDEMKVSRTKSKKKSFLLRKF